MEENVFNEILKYWQRFSKKEKIAHLQMYEALNAKIQNRPEREIVMIKPEIKNDILLAGQYQRNNPTILKIAQIDEDEFDAINCLDSTYHEGYHSLFHDFILSKTDLKTFADIDKQKFYEQYQLNYLTYMELMDTLINMYIKNKDNVINFKQHFTFEEQLTYKESLIYTTYNLLKFASSKSSLEYAYDSFEIVIKNFLFHEKILHQLPIPQNLYLQAKEKANLTYKILKDFKNITDFQDETIWARILEKYEMPTEIFVESKKEIKNFATPNSQKPKSLIAKRTTPMTQEKAFEIVLKLIESVLKNSAISLQNGTSYVKFEKAAKLINEQKGDL